MGVFLTDPALPKEKLQLLKEALRHAGLHRYLDWRIDVLDPASIGVLSTGEALAVPVCSAALIYSTTTSTPSMLSKGFAPCGKRRCATCTSAVGGDDRLTIKVAVRHAAKNYPQDTHINAGFP